MIYLDNAATTLIRPDCVIDAVAAAMRSAGNAGHGVNEASLASLRTVTRTRELLAELAHFPDPNRVCFTSNVTEALNTVIFGLFRPGDRVITTMLEHNSVLRPLYRLEEEGTISLDILPADRKGRLDLRELGQMMEEGARALVLGQASNLTGNVQDLETIGEICRRHGVLLIVDAAQSAGIVPIDMERMNIAVLCVTGHKTLLGPQGTGAILVRKDVEIRPLKTGGTGVHSYEHGQPEAYPEHLEAGTLNTHGIAGLCAALEFRKACCRRDESAFGRDAAGGRTDPGAWELTLAKHFHEAVRDLPGVTVYGDFGEPGEDVWDPESPRRVGIVTLNIGDWDSAAVSEELAERFGIATRSGAHCAPLCHEALGTVEQGAVRFSFGWGNTEADVRAAAEAVRILASEQDLPSEA